MSWLLWWQIVLLMVLATILASMVVGAARGNKP